MGFIFWGLLGFVFFDLRIAEVVMTPDFVGFLMVFIGMEEALLKSRTVAKYRWTCLLYTSAPCGPGVTTLRKTDDWERAAVCCPLS